MIKKGEKLYIGIFITIIFSVTVFSSIYAREKDKVTENIIQESTIPSPEINNDIDNKPKTKTVKSGIENQEDNREFVTILAGKITTHLVIAANTLFYDALVEGKNDGKITFNGKNYPGLGFFVTEIGTLRADSGKYLLYYINGKQASVGVSSYTLKDGDIIEWKLE